MKKRDIAILCSIICMILVVFCIGLANCKSAPVEKTVEVKSSIQEETESSTADLNIEATEAARKYLETNPAESYLLVTTSNGEYSPIPLSADRAFRLTQEDGSENVVHIGINSFYMESSNCDNQNCVEEGEVTLENYKSRILFNMVICLPHQVTLEFLTPDEAFEKLISQYISIQTAMNAA